MSQVLATDNKSDKRIQEMFLEGSNPPLPIIQGLYELLRDEANVQQEIHLSSDDLRQHLGPRTNPMAIHTALSVLNRSQAIERFDIPGQRLRGTRLLQPNLPAEKLEIDTHALAEKAERDAAKLNAMIQFCYSRGCSFWNDGKGVHLPILKLWLNIIRHIKLH